MFGYLKNKKDKTIYTKEELKKAISNKEPEIIVGGDLAKQLKWIAKLSVVKIGLLIVALGSLAIATGGTSIAATGVASLTAASGIAATSGVADIVGEEIAMIIFCSGLSIAIILSILKGYNVEIEGNKVKLTIK